MEGVASMVCIMSDKMDSDKVLPRNFSNRIFAIQPRVQYVPNTHIFAQSV